MFVALFSLACVFVSKSLSQNQCSFNSFNNMMRMILLLSTQLQITNEVYLNWNLTEDRLDPLPT